VTTARLRIGAVELLRCEARDGRSAELSERSLASRAVDATTVRRSSRWCVARRRAWRARLRRTRALEHASAMRREARPPPATRAIVRRAPRIDRRAPRSAGAPPRRSAAARSSPSRSLPSSARGPWAGPRAARSRPRGRARSRGTPPSSRSRTRATRIATIDASIEPRSTERTSVGQARYAFVAQTSIVAPTNATQPSTCPPRSRCQSGAAIRRSSTTSSRGASTSPPPP